MAQCETCTFFPPLGQYGGPAEDPWPLAAGVDPLDLDAHRGKDVLLVAEPFDPNYGPSLGPYGPLGEIVYPEGGEWGWTGEVVTIYPAATTGRSSRNDDIPAATWVPGALAPSLNFGQSLFDGVDPMKRSSTSKGVIELNDPSGVLDYLDGYIWDNAALTLKRGARGTLFSTWETVARFNAAGCIGDVDVRQIRLRDLGWQLSGLLHSEYYGGTGGLDGDTSLQGKWKPYACGYVFNAEPKQISATAQIFQCSFTSVEAIYDLRHGCVSLPFHADYATFELLRDAAIPGGKWGSCRAQGLVRPNVTLQYGIRVDLCGDSSLSNGRGTPTTRAAVARRIATTYGPNRIDDSSQIDATAFDYVESQNGALCGWYWDSEISKADALTEVMLGILGWWRVRPDGRLSIGFVRSPTRGSILTIEHKSYGMGKPRVVDWAPPRAGTYMGWKRNYSPQSRDQIAPSVTEADAAIYSQDARYASALNPSVTAKYPTALTAIVPGNFWLEADATNEATRHQDILGVERRRWQWTMQVDPNIDLLGQVATLSNLNRLGSGPALPLLCVGIDTAGSDITTFDWWG